VNTYRQVGPSQTTSHAAFVACRAARDARLAGLDEDAQRRAYDWAYTEALREQVAA
jgi:hypothetical protein